MAGRGAGKRREALKFPERAPRYRRKNHNQRPSYTPSCGSRRSNARPVQALMCCVETATHKMAAAASGGGGDQQLRGSRGARRTVPPPTWSTHQHPARGYICRCLMSQRRQAGPGGWVGGDRAGREGDCSKVGQRAGERGSAGSHISAVRLATAPAHSEAAGETRAGKSAAA